ncbi:MAG: SDR family oxidoreductase [Fidelibacterota bacterium]
MKVLFIGGTGTISSASSQLAVHRGIDLYLLTRGKSFRPLPKGAKTITADINDKQAVEKALGEQTFDVVVNWVVFSPDQIERDIELFRNRTSQYIFISSASAYQTPPGNLPVTESTTLANPFWEYSRNKIDCEKKLVKAHREFGFPFTIVRPSHTYDKTVLPMHGGYTIIDRMRKGKKVIVHGDGTSIWVLTHHRDFAKGFVGLLGNNRAIGEKVHITTDELLTWNQIFELVAKAAGIKPKIVHIPSDVIAKYDKDWGDSLLGDKMHSMIFDNTKIKRLVPDFAATIPFAQGAKEIIDFYDSHPGHSQVDKALNEIMDKIIKDYEG